MSIDEIRKRLKAHEATKAQYLAALAASPDDDTRERRMAKRAAHNAAQLLEAFAPDDLRTLLARIDALEGALGTILEALASADDTETAKAVARKALEGGAS